MSEKMLIKDGVKYELWTPPKERHDFEPIVTEHVEDIFGKKSIYIDRKKNLVSASGIVSIPDGYVIDLQSPPQWYIVEVETSSHPPHEHVAPQLNKFTTWIERPKDRSNIVDAIYEYIHGDISHTQRLKVETKCVDIHKFLSDLINIPPIIAVIVEKKTDELDDALNIFRKSYKVEIVEFQTFVRERVGLEVHAHLFEPLYKPVVLTEPRPPEVAPETMEIKVWHAYMDYEYIGIWKKFRHLFPDSGAKVELITNDGDVFQAEVFISSGDSMALGNLGEWFRKNPHLKEGDKIRITPIEEKRKYHLEIVKE